MAIKENMSKGNKRPRLSENSTQQQHLVLNVNNVINQQNNYHNHQQHNHIDQRSSFDSDSDRWSELFDSFKDTNHLKEMHCR